MDAVDACYCGLGDALVEQLLNLCAIGVELQLPVERTFRSAQNHTGPSPGGKALARALRNEYALRLGGIGLDRQNEFRHGVVGKTIVLLEGNDGDALAQTDVHDAPHYLHGTAQT